jgi:gliotoxin/aspirochlorine biosynthesis peptide synthetase
MALVELFGSLCFGGTLVLKNPDDPFAHLKHVDAIVTTPSLLSALSASEYSNLDTVLVAGEPITQALADTWAAKVKKLINVYGPSEVRLSLIPDASDTYYIWNTILPFI